MNKWEKVAGEPVNRTEVHKLADRIPKEWFLLEVLRTDKNGRAEMMEVIAHAKEKDELRELLMELDPENRNFIFYFSDPDKECEI